MRAGKENDRPIFLQPIFYARENHRLLPFSATGQRALRSIEFVRHRFDSRFDFTDVPFALLLVPLANRIGPDLIEILSCQGRESIARHYLVGFDFRLRAIKASKSKGFDGPLFSPAIA